MGRMRVFIPGGAGGVGEGIVRAALARGHAAIVPSRSEGKLATLRKRVERVDGLITLVGQIGEPEGAEEIRARVEREIGTLDAIVPSLGGWWEGGRVTDMTATEWDDVMNEMLRAHFIVARTFVPVLERQGFGRYVGIGGGAAYNPIRNAAPVSIAAAAQVMLTRALRAEIANPRVGIFELVADGPVRTRDSQAIAQSDWITADDVGRVALDLVETGKTLEPGTSVSGPIVRMREPRREA